MSELEPFLADLRQRGVKLWVEGDKLKVRGADDVLSSDLTNALKRRKAEILALLQPKAAHRIPPLPTQDSYELSAAQRRLWVLAQMPDGSAAYNVPLHQILEGPLDRGAMGAAFARLVERHQSLRATFMSIEGEPRQVVHAHVAASIAFHDLSGTAGADTAVRQLGRSDAARPFDLETGPLWRVRLLKLAAARHALLLTIHHLIADGISLAVLARDLSELYDTACTGRPDNLPILSFGYPGYAAWHNRLLDGELMAPHRAYWHGALSGLLPVLALPLDRPRPPIQRFRGRELTFVLSPERLEALRAFARQRNATLFMAVHAVVKALLFAYTGQDDIIVGCAVGGRDHPELGDQVGLYLNTLALRSRVSGDESFDDFFDGVARQTKEAFDHQVYPFDRLVGELSVARDLSRSPIFDVMLIEQSQEEPGLDLSGLSARPAFEHTATSKFDLTFCFKAIPATGLVLGIEYNTDLFDDDRIARMGGHFAQLIDSVLADPSEAVGRLNILPNGEREQLIHAFNQTASPYPRDLTIVDLLETAAATHPDAVALVCGGRATTYRELHAQAHRLARHLQGLGLGAGDTAGICLERSPELVAALLAVLKTGAAYVPLDPHHPRERMMHIVDDARIAVLIHRGSEHAPPAQGLIRSVDLDADCEEIARRSGEPLLQSIAPDHLAYVIYTSGTTGRPKGVEIPHRALTNFLLAMAERPGLTEKDVLLAVTTISFDIAALEIFLPLVRGARVVIAEDDDVADGARLLELMERSGPTVMQGTPSTWQLLLNGGWSGSPGLKVICGGEALPGWLGEQLLMRAHSVWNMYGPTETTVWSTSCKLDRNDVPRGAVGSIGRPIANTEIYILDRQRRPVPIGVAGDLYIGGDGLAAGYRNLPELTAERFVRHPFRSEGESRIYLTGDLARYRANGSIEYLGRSDQQVKLRGFRIETGEIESVLTEHHAVRQAVVDMRPDAAGDHRLIAWYVGLPDKEVSAGDLQDHLRRKLPDYMIPAFFYAVAAMPATPNGKVDRKALSEPGQEAARSAAYEPPRNDWERQLAALWQQVLGVSKIGIHDNFFELGGHSLKATAFLARLQRESGLRLDLVDAFRYPGLAALAAHCAMRSADKANIGPSSPVATADPSSRRLGPALTDQETGIRPASDEELELLSRL